MPGPINSFGVLRASWNLFQGEWYFLSVNNYSLAVWFYISIFPRRPFLKRGLGYAVNR